MTYFGRVRNGVVVLDEPAQLPEGYRVQIQIPEHECDDKPIWQIALELAAAVPPAEWEKLPKDGSINLDHYLYGTPKVEE